MSAMPKNEAQQAQEFEQALETIGRAGADMKQAVQIGLRYATKAALYRKDIGPINRLDAKLATLESNYYKKQVRANFAAYCGYISVELDGKGNNRYYRLDAEKAPIVYSKEKGNKGWQIKTKNLDACKAVYEKYFDNVHFMGVKIEEKAVDKSLAEKMADMVNGLKDTARQIRDSKELWQGLNDAQVKAILEYMAAMPNI